MASPLAAIFSGIGTGIGGWGEVARENRRLQFEAEQKAADRKLRERELQRLEEAAFIDMEPLAQAMPEMFKRPAGLTGPWRMPTAAYTAMLPELRKEREAALRAQNIEKLTKLIALRAAGAPPQGPAPAAPTGPTPMTPQEEYATRVQQGRVERLLREKDLLTEAQQTGAAPMGEGGAGTLPLPPEQPSDAYGMEQEMGALQTAPSTIVPPPPKAPPTTRPGEVAASPITSGPQAGGPAPATPTGAGPVMRPSPLSMVKDPADLQLMLQLIEMGKEGEPLLKKLFPEAVRQPAPQLQWTDRGLMATWLDPQTGELKSQLVPDATKKPDTDKASEPRYVTDASGKEWVMWRGADGQMVSRPVEGPTGVGQAPKASEPRYITDAQGREWAMWRDADGKMQTRQVEGVQGKTDKWTTYMEEDAKGPYLVAVDPATNQPTVTRIPGVGPKPTQTSSDQAFVVAVNEWFTAMHDPKRGPQHPDTLRASVQMGGLLRLPSGRTLEGPPQPTPPGERSDLQKLDRSALTITELLKAYEDPAIASTFGTWISNPEGWIARKLDKWTGWLLTEEQRDTIAKSAHAAGLLRRDIAGLANTTAELNYLREYVWSNEDPLPVIMSKLRGAQRVLKNDRAAIINILRGGGNRYAVPPDPTEPRPQGGAAKPAGAAPVQKWGKDAQGNPVKLP
jgi:hypothetical protein